MVWLTAIPSRPLVTFLCHSIARVSVQSRSSVCCIPQTPAGCMAIASSAQFYLYSIVSLSGDSCFAITLRSLQSLPFQQFQALLTLFSESFASFPYGTCLLSVSHRVFSLRWSIPPISGCTLKQPDSLHALSAELDTCHPHLWSQSLREFHPLCFTFPGELEPFDCACPRVQHKTTIPSNLSKTDKSILAVNLGF